jgi:hypothetical protein
LEILLEATQPSVSRKYKRSLHTEDFALGQKDDIDLDAPIVHGEALAGVMGDVNFAKDQLAKLAFNEEPITIIIEENTRSDFPETFVPVTVQGKGAEVFENGRWMEVGWLPIGREIITRRKYVEVLIGSKSDSVKTTHDDATVERPRNTVSRRTSSNYPVTILNDANPLGREWVARIRQAH